jgi:MFS family permease
MIQKLITEMKEQNSPSDKCQSSASVVSVNSHPFPPKINPRVAFNSTPSYTYFMVERFNIADRKSDIGFYLGLITTSFLASQSLTNPFWGWTSDRIGRKPVVMIGTLGTCIGFLLFGFAETYTWVSP